MTKEEAIEYRRNYYLRNREKILRKYHEEAEKKRQKKKQEADTNSDEEMLREWSRRLSERLKEEDLDDWLRWSLELTRNEIMKKIDTLEDSEKVDKKGRKTRI